MEKASPFLRLSLESAVVIDSMRIFGLVCAAPRTGAVALLAVLPLLQAQTGWPGFGRDKGAQRYSPSDQINTQNVSKLIPAWNSR